MTDPKNNGNGHNTSTTADDDNETQDISTISTTNNMESIVPWVVQFRIVGTPHVLRSTISKDILIGRQDHERGIVPDIDLTDYDAAAQGVSRRHARLTAKDNRITIEDLGSHNGTFINSRQIGILKPMRIYDGDRVRLGALELQVNFVVKPLKDDNTVHNLNINVPRFGEGELLLVVDENEDVCQVVHFFASKAGFRVCAAHSINEAVNYIDDEQVNLALVEMLLPDGDGLDVLHYLRQHQPGAPVMMSSGTGKSAALAAGATLFLPKPIAVDDLLEGLRTLHSALSS